MENATLLHVKACGTVRSVTTLFCKVTANGQIDLTAFCE
jgi:hypothetical protein